MDLPPHIDRAAAGLGGALFTAAVFLMKRQWAMAGVMAVSGTLLGYGFGEELGTAWRISDKAGSAILASLGSVSTWKLIEGIHSFDVKRAGRELWLGFLRKVGIRK